jgi:hypothetical protein
MFHGFSLAYAPSFVPGLTLSVNRVCLVPWERENLKYMFPEALNSPDSPEDQKASLGFTWVFPQVGFEIYGEIGFDDYAYGRPLGYIRNPFHTTVYAAGLRKVFNISPQKEISGELFFEFNWMEMTQDFQFQWPYSFYFHHIDIHGYTNKGQILANAVSPGGNSQYLGFRFYYPKGRTLLFISRINPDDNYLYAKAIDAKVSEEDLNHKYHTAFKANFLLGINILYALSSSFMISSGLVYDLQFNPKYQRANVLDNNYLHNFSIQLGLSYKL